MKAAKALQSTAKDLKKQAVVQAHEKALSAAAPLQAKLQEEPVPETPSLNDVSNTAGRPKYFVTHWTQITADPVVLTWLQGNKIHFSRPVYQHNPPHENKISSNELNEIVQFVDELCSKGAVQKCTYVKDQFVSLTFLVPKPDGTTRFILNLKKPNEFIGPVNFKLEDGRTVYRLLFQNCSMATLVLRDAYYSIPIHENHRNYALRFYKNYETCGLFSA